ncbi:hypothetical protein RI367_006942 [Sorochytrium milnesiophthora]
MDLQQAIGNRLQFKDYDQRYIQRLHVAVGNLQAALAAGTTDAVEIDELMDNVALLSDLCTVRAEKHQLAAEMELHDQCADYRGSIEEDERKMPTQQEIDAILTLREESRLNKKNKLDYERAMEKVNTLMSRPDIIEKTALVDSEISQAEEQLVEEERMYKLRQQELTTVLAGLQWLRQSVSATTHADGGGGGVDTTAGGSQLAADGAEQPGVESVFGQLDRQQNEDSHANIAMTLMHDDSAMDVDTTPTKPRGSSPRMSTKAGASADMDLDEGEIKEADDTVTRAQQQRLAPLRTQSPLLRSSGLSSTDDAGRRERDNARSQRGRSDSPSVLKPVAPRPVSELRSSSVQSSTAGAEPISGPKRSLLGSALHAMREFHDATGQDRVKSRSTETVDLASSSSRSASADREAGEMSDSGAAPSTKRLQDDTRSATASSSPRVSSILHDSSSPEQVVRSATAEAVSSARQAETSNSGRQTPPSIVWDDAVSKDRHSSKDSKAEPDDRQRSTGKDRERTRDRDRDRDSKERDRDRDRDRERERDIGNRGSMSERDRTKERDKGRERGRERDPERDKEREREKDRDRDRSGRGRSGRGDRDRESAEVGPQPASSGSGSAQASAPEAPSSSNQEQQQERDRNRDKDRDRERGDDSGRDRNKRNRRGGDRRREKERSSGDLLADESGDGNAGGGSGSSRKRRRRG